ncbi:MAG: LysM peptidoglycan-binding domain-containing protein [Myxococcota bacterium]
MNKVLAVMGVLLSLDWGAGFGEPAWAQHAAESEWMTSTEQRQRPVRDSPATLSESRQTGRGITIRGRERTRDVPAAHQVRRGDTLWDLAQRYYGSHWHWPRLWSYNPEVTNPHWIYPNDIVRLRPGLGSAALPVQGRATPRGLILHESDTVWLRDEGYLDRDALQRSAVIVGSPEEHMLLSEWDEVYLRFENEQDIRPGAEYTVFRRVPSRERMDDEKGALVRIYGTIRLQSYDAQSAVARGVVTEALDPIERGDRVAAIPRRFDMIEPVSSERDLNAKVVAALRPREFHADSQIIFIDVGELQGVRVGNRVFVVREADEWLASYRDVGIARRASGETFEHAEEAENYPLEVIAEGRVVNLRPNTAGLLVTRSVREVVMGDRVELRRGF